MDNRIKTWLTLVAVGTVLGFVALLVARSARVHEAWGWITGISIFLNFFMAGMVGNARNAANRANEIMTAMYDRMQRNISPEPVYIEPHKTTFGTTDLEPAYEHRSLPVEEAERIGREAEEAERRRKQDEYWKKREKEKSRTAAGFEQGHMKRPSPTPSVEAWYRGVDGVYRQKRR